MFPYYVSWLRHRRVVKCVKQGSFLRSWQSARSSQLCSQEPNVGPYLVLAECSPHLTPLWLKSILIFLLPQPTHPASSSSRIFQQKIWTQIVSFLCVLQVSPVSLVLPNSLYKSFFFFTVRVVSLAHLQSWSIAHCRLSYIVYSIYIRQPEDSSYHDGKLPINMAFRTFWKL